MTLRAVEAAKSVAQPATKIEGVTGSFGAAIINSETDMVIGAFSAIDLAAKFSAGYDAIGLSVSFDVGLRALREMLQIPVVGMAEASIYRALELGERIVLVSFGARTKALYEQLALQYMTEKQLAGVYCLDALSKTELEDLHLLQRIVANVVEKVRFSYDCDVIVLLATAFAGLGLDRSIEFPLVDPVAAMIKLLEESARNQDLVSLLTDDRWPENKVMRGVSPELSSLYLNFPVYR